MTDSKSNRKGMQINIPQTPYTSSSHRRAPSSAQTTNSRRSAYSSLSSSHAVVNTSNSDHFHKRKVSAANVPLPSHRPPTTFHSFRVDLKAQDVFCEYIKKRNPKVQILFPGEDAFEMNRQDMWNHDDICTPCLILQPKYPKEISDICKAYTRGVTSLLRANHFHGTSLAIPRLITAGGRNSMFGMKEGAIVLDLSRMRAVQVNLGEGGGDDSEGGTATCTVQGGARVEDVIEALGELGYMAVTGMHPNLGIVGSILAGGYGYASRQYGLACDNILRAQVILADGRLKTCHPTKHDDLFWSLKGGGGGMGVVVNVTMRIYPMRHAALLKYSLLVPGPEVIMQRQMILKHWANWIAGDVDNDDVSPDQVLVPRTPRDHIGRESNDEALVAPKEVYSQLCLPTDSTAIHFLGTSIDTKAISQSDGFLDLFNNQSRKSHKKRGPFAFLGNNNKTESRVPMGWDKIDGLADLIDDKFGMVSRSEPQFSLVRYDELHEHGNQGLEAGNLYLAMKYTKSLTNQIIHYLVGATTTNSLIPNGDSRIYIISLGGKIKEVEGENSAFCGRDMNYVIFIEGKWNATNVQKSKKEKTKVKNWVDTLVSQLHRCSGVRSTAHPESARDQVRKSGKKPPTGWYNFNEDTGKRLTEIKNRRDPQKVFSLSTRVSWTSDFSSNESAVAVASIATLGSVDVVKDGEINPSDCLSPIHGGGLRSLKSADSGSDSIFDESSSEDKEMSACEETKEIFNDSEGEIQRSEDDRVPVTHDEDCDSSRNAGSRNDDVDRMTDDMKVLLSMTESEDDEMKDWILPSIHLNDTDSIEDDAIGSNLSFI